jgi:hypothetical protein
MACPSVFLDDNFAHCLLLQVQRLGAAVLENLADTATGKIKRDPTDLAASERREKLTFLNSSFDMK